VKTEIFVDIRRNLGFSRGTKN